MLRQESYARTREDHEASDGRRNPYPADCGERRSHHQGQGASRRERVSGSRTGQSSADRPGLERYTRPVSARGGSTGSRISAVSTGGGRRVSRAGRPEEARLFLYEEDGLSLPEEDGLPTPYGEEDGLSALYGEERELSLPYGEEDGLSALYGEERELFLPYGEENDLPLSYGGKGGPSLPHKEEGNDLSLLYDGIPERRRQKSANITSVNMTAGYKGVARREAQGGRAAQSRREPYGREGTQHLRRTDRRAAVPVEGQFAETAPGGRKRYEERTALRETGYKKETAQSRRESYGRGEEFGRKAAQPRRESYGRGAETRPRRREPDIDETPVYRHLPRGRAARGTAGRRSPSAHTRSRRKKRVLEKRLMIGVWALCILALGVVFVLKNPPVAAAGKDGKGGGGIISAMGDAFFGRQSAGPLVQGLPESVFAAHPQWEENFLTPNEYSRPGEPLESVTNLFVHYTANPGTSAAQNRSYFEQQKDTHEVSVSSHFIIGYEGEIIQCVPLDEIAYAVMTRNYDSVSIECCYLESDGSFTQETYDSLISLLAWLTDAYNLDADDILRHYDCGGKKCPLYYTEHPDAWEQLKKDVDKL